MQLNTSWLLPVARLIFEILVAKRRVENGFEAAEELWWLGWF